MKVYTRGVIMVNTFYVVDLDGAFSISMVHMNFF